jgi:hypothetical protein
MVKQFINKRGIKTIVISGSMKFKQGMTELSHKLKSDGYKRVVEPSDKEYIEGDDVIDKAMNYSIYEKIIEHADLLLVYDEEGYVGLSTAMEIQKALDCKVPVRFLFEPEAIEFQSLCKHPDYDIKVDTKYLD